MWPLRKQMRKPFITTRSGVCKKNSSKNEHVCVYGKEIFLPKWKGRVHALFCCRNWWISYAAPIVSALPPYYYSTYPYNTEILLPLDTKMRWWKTPQLILYSNMWYRGCTNALPLGKLFLCYRWSKGKYSKQ